jgi:predicted nucleic acid-binding protein
MNLWPCTRRPWKSRDEGSPKTIVEGLTQVQRRRFYDRATPLDHWIRVGDLRRTLARKGVSVTIPDAHVAQCALDLDAVLLTSDGVFNTIAKHVPLRVR